MNIRPNPYVGPRAFQPGEPFYGRDRELRSLAALLIAERIVLLHSPSGSGKTSLIQAGLLPRLREENFNVLPIIRVNTELPKSVVAIAGVNRYALSTMLSLEESLPEAERRPVSELATLTLDSYLSTRLRSEGTPVSDVLIFDQFEEVLTYAPTDRESKLVFFEQLGKALRNKDRWTLIAIREDYLGALAPYTRPIPGRLGATFRLDLLGVDGALQAIQKPAQANSVNFLASAAAKLADDLRRIQVQLPDGSLEEQLGPHVEPVQLQVVCYRLWQGLTDDDAEIDESDLAGVGDVNRALADYYAASVQSVAVQSTASEREIREWFDHKLITPEGIRGQVLMGAEHSDGLPNRVVALLEDAHIIRGEKRAGKTWFELSHDRMIKPVRENNAAWFSANLSLFQQQAVLWVQQGRPDGMLLRGKPLVEAEHEVIRLQLTEDETAFLAACRKLRETERRDKLRTRISQGLMVVALIAMVVAVVFGVRASNSEKQAQQSLSKAQQAESTAVVAGSTAKAASTQAVSAFVKVSIASTELAHERDMAELSAKIARAGELAAESVVLRDTNFQISMLLGVEAHRSVETIQSLGALLDNAQANPHVQKILNNHAGTSDLAFSPDGKTLASSSYDNNNIILWDITTSEPIGQPLIEHKRGVDILAFSPDGKTLVSSGCGKFDQDGYTCLQGEIILWDVVTRQPIGQPLTGDTSEAYNLVFSPDGQTLASSSCGKFDQDGGYTCLQGEIILWDIITHQPIGQPFTGDTGRIDSLAFSPLDGGKTLAFDSCGKFDEYGICLQGEIILWDTATRQPIGQPLNGHTGGIDSLAFSPDGKTLASGSDGNIILWDVATRKPIGQPLTGHRGSISLTFSPDGKTLASGACEESLPSGCGHGKMILWDVSPMLNTGAVTRQPMGQTFEYAHDVSSLTFSPDGKMLAFGSYDYENIILWNVAAGQAISQPLSGHAGSVSSVAFSPDGKTLASGDCGKLNQDGYVCLQGEIILWDVATRQPIGQPLSGHTSEVYNLAFSPLDGGKTLASGGCGKFDENGTCIQGEIIFWDTATRQPIGQPLKGHTSWITSLVFSPDGKMLASGSPGNTIILWDVSTRQPIGQPLTSHIDGEGPQSVNSLAFSPDGKKLASGTGNFMSGGFSGRIILWDVATRQPIGQPFTGHRDGISSIAFSPDGKTLASGSDDTTIILWDVVTGQPIGQPLTNHTNGVSSVAFSPDGKTLASGGCGKKDDAYNCVQGEIILWDVATRQPIGQPLTGHTDSIFSVAFSPDGKTLASGSGDKSIILWDLDPQSWIEKICQRAGRNFTRAEWAQYFSGEDYRKTCPQWPEEPVLQPDATATATPSQ